MCVIVCARVVVCVCVCVCGRAFPNCQENLARCESGTYNLCGAWRCLPLGSSEHHHHNTTASKETNGGHKLKQ